MRPALTLGQLPVVYFMNKLKKILSPMSYGWIIIFLLGSLFHFIYEMTGDNFFVGLVAPVNESIWEHLKLALVPVPLGWGIYYLLYRDSLDKNHWFTGCMVALITTFILILGLYYTYTEALGVELVVVDILVFMVAIFGGHHMARHFYKRYKQIPFRYAFGIVILLIILFVYFTVSPPELPIFLDGPSQTYGIYKT